MTDGGAATTKSGQTLKVGGQRRRGKQQKIIVAKKLIANTSVSKARKFLIGGILLVVLLQFIKNDWKNIRMVQCPKTISGESGKHFS
jgi:hypothetical protein